MYGWQGISCAHPCGTRNPSSIPDWWRIPSPRHGHHGCDKGPTHIPERLGRTGLSRCFRTLARRTLHSPPGFLSSRGLQRSLFVASCQLSVVRCQWPMAATAHRSSLAASPLKTENFEPPPDWPRRHRGHGGGSPLFVARGLSSLPVVRGSPLASAALDLA